MIKSLVMIGLFTWSLLPPLCAQVVFPSVPSTPSGRGSQANYQIGSEVGCLFMGADGNLDWVLRAVPGVLASKVESQAPFDVGYSVARFGNSRRFLISGYDSQGSIGRIALVELRVSPQSIQLLSVADYQGEPTTLTHNFQSSELFVYNFANSRIEQVDFPISNIQVPSHSEFSTILTFAPPSYFWKQIFISLGIPPGGLPSGAILAEVRSELDTIHRIESQGGVWSLTEHHTETLPRWEPGSMYMPSQGPLFASAAGRMYHIMRLDVGDDPVLVSSGDFGEDVPSSGQMVQLTIPQEGLIPGATYFIKHVGVDDTSTPTGADGTSFTPLSRSGIPFSGANVKIGQGYSAAERSEIGNTKYSVGVYVDWLEDFGLEENYTLFLYWGLANPDGSQPILGFGDSAILTNPLGVIGRNITLGEGNSPLHIVTVPLTDPRLTVDPDVALRVRQAELNRA